MKTGLEYLDLLNKADQIRFLRNFSEQRIDKSISDYLMVEFRSFHKFIAGSFKWSHTIEGYDYWYNISNSHIV